MSSSHGPSRKPEAKYPFEVLPSGNWTRILHLEAANESHEPLIGHLQNIDLKDLGTLGRWDLANGNRGQERHNRSPFRYEALSWCWGNDAPSEVLSLRDDETQKKYRIRISSNLARALRSLRYYPDDADTRRLWVDAVCINLEDDNERAHQVAQMNLVYGSASNVCVWLDDQPRTLERYGYSAKELFNFIEKQLLNVSSFDEVIKARANARRWLALIQLMTKKWFSRRWIIQEVALAHKATIYCGDGKIKWDKFAHAVALFIKAESANHQLSDIVRRDETLDNRFGVFRDIDRMGAASLVDITATIKNNAVGISQSTSSLETLMARLPMCEATKPCDTIYALLSIARDVKPEAEGMDRRSPDFRKAWKYVKRFGDGEEGMRKLDKACKVAEMLTAGLNIKPYVVSYSKPSIDVYQYFVEFCIYQSRSLDIICRPWAPKPEIKTGEPHLNRTGTGLSEQEEDSSGSDSDYRQKSIYSSDSTDEEDDEDEKRIQWEARARAAMRAEKWRGLPGTGPPSELHSDAGDFMRSPPMRQTTDFSDSEGPQPAKPSYTTRRKRSRPSHPIELSTVLPPQQTSNKMPSWISDRQNTAFTLLADDAMTQMERKNADPLVGSPENRPYRASGTRGVRMREIRFLRRSEYDQSLFVQGFKLDTIAECEQPSDQSNIPPSWFEFANFGPGAKKAPSDLYRTLIGNRGLNGVGPPPAYFPLAYSVALDRDRSTTLDNRTVINEGKSIVTEFLERVRQVIWGRRLAKTAKPIKIGRDGKAKTRLALVPKDTNSNKGARRGDHICILYGLSVPVVLRSHVKTSEEKEADRVARQKQLPDAYQKAVRCIERFWSFRKELERTIYFMDEDEIKGKFSKLWLDKIRADFGQKLGMGAKTIISQTEKPERLIADRTKEVQDRLWKSMCEEWDEMLEDGDYKWKSDKFEDTSIAIPVKTGDDEYFEVIGEAYVDQMMDGEALLYKQENQLKDEIFELR